MDPVGGMLVMLTHVDESSRELNQAFVERARFGFAPLLQPKRFQHIMGLVVVTLIEMMEIGGVAHIPTTGIDALPKHRDAT